MPALNVPQAAFLQMPNKFRAYVGGFGSGKTWAGCSAMGAHFWQSPRVSYGYFAPTYPHIRDIFYPTVEEVAHGLGLRVKVREGVHEVDFYSGRVYRGTTICRSMEHPDRIVGFKIGRAMIDEFDVLDPAKAMKAWRKIIARLRWENAGNGADVTTTPEGFRTTHKLFVADVAEKPDKARNYGIVQASTRANAANLPPDYIPTLFETYPAELVAAYIDGQFCNLTTGTVYRGYNRTRHESNETIQPGEPLFIGMDFNVGKMAATIYVLRPNGWHAVAELRDVFDTPAMVEAIRGRWRILNDAQRRVVIYPDASGASRKTVDASKSDIAVLQQAGFEVRANGTNPAVRDRILSVNRQFERGQLWVNSRACPTVASCFEQQAYDKNGEPDKKSGFDHQNDASGYPIAYEFPIIRPMVRVRVGGT
jgi:hypothetical protein